MQNKNVQKYFLTLPLYFIKTRHIKELVLHFRWQKVNLLKQISSLPCSCWANQSHLSNLCWQGGTCFELAITAAFKELDSTFQKEEQTRCNLFAFLHCFVLHHQAYCISDWLYVYCLCASWWCLDMFLVLKRIIH